MQVEVSKTDMHLILVDKKGILVVKSESSGDLTNIIQQERDRRRIKANAEKSAATDADIKNLSEEIMEDWWKKNKSNFVK